MARCQQAVALCRVDRAQPTNRASGVRCTPWLGRSDIYYLHRMLILVFREAIIHLYDGVHLSL